MTGISAYALTDCLLWFCARCAETLRPLIENVLLVAERTVLSIAFGLVV